MAMRRIIPWMMAAGRAALGPVVVVGERCGWSGLTLAALIVAALVSDIFDGVLARRWQCDTAGVRLLDSMADTFFYVCVVTAVGMGMPAVWTAYRGPVLMLLGLEAGRMAFDLAKFGKPASYHSYLAKMWGLLLAAAVVATFVVGRPSALMEVAVVVGVICNLEGIAMSVMLPAWRKDVKTLAAAWRLRRELAWPVRGVAVKAAAAVLVLLMAVPVFALEPGQATYVGGTVSGLERGVEGRLELTDPLALVFVPTLGSRLEMPYARISEYKQREENTHRLSALLAVGVALLGVRQHTYTVTLNYTDGSGVAQVATLAVPRQDVKVVGNVLRERVPKPVMKK